MVDNIESFLNGRPLDATYTGYSSCPIVTSAHAMLLAEFDYDLNLTPSLPVLDPTKPHRGSALHHRAVGPRAVFRRDLVRLLKPGDVRCRCMTVGHRCGHSPGAGAATLLFVRGDRTAGPRLGADRHGSRELLSGRR